MASSNTSAFFVGNLFVLFIVTVIWIDDVVELAQLTFEMGGFDFEVVKWRLYEA